MPPALRLVSPWWTNVLDLAGLFRHLPFSMVSAPEYAAYLDEYRRCHRIAVCAGTEVRGVRAAAHGTRSTPRSARSARARAGQSAELP